MSNPISKGIFASLVEAIQMTILCSTCQNPFVKYQNARRCKACAQAYQNKYRKERYAQDPAYRSKVKEKSSAYQRQNPKSKLKSVLKAYGLTLSGYENLLQLQGGVCKVCSRSPDENKRLEIDHDHATGRVRGLLCGLCNKGLGLFQDSPEILSKALQYLKEK
jgi:hypothetical protein